MKKILQINKIGKIFLNLKFNSCNILYFKYNNFCNKKNFLQ